MRALTKNKRRRQIHSRLRSKIQGTAPRPRLVVFRSLKHMYAQLVDDLSGHTLASASTLSLEGKRLEHGGNLEAARRVGQLIAEQARGKNIDTVVFDRGGYAYHGRVRAVAQAAREAGLKF